MNFDTLPLKDNTQGLVFEMDKENILALEGRPVQKYIDEKTQLFYKPKQSDGELANLNLIVFDCVDFSNSTELNVFLEKTISKSHKSSRLH